MEMGWILREGEESTNRSGIEGVGYWETEQNEQLIYCKSFNLSVST